ncbi:MAG: GyrI-like domain-containing protein [Clostridia bacterium]|nr:GyrI-like domain-containing protein [Clostridia bacterium]
MKIEKITKTSCIIIGMEGSTKEGEGFISRLWEEANSRFGEIAHLVKTDDNGMPAGIWGAMTDLSRSFSPWTDNFSTGYYLAGAECTDDAEAPEGWTRWILPGFEYIQIACGDGDTFAAGLTYLQEHGLSLAGAVQDFTSPASGTSYMRFPIRRL